MPNWCENVLSIDYITNSKKAYKLLEQLDNNVFFDFIIPKPEFSNDEEENKKNTGFKDWYDWSMHNWGVKWDAEIYSHAYDETTGSLMISFNTPWGPPNEKFLLALAKYFDGKNSQIFNYYYEPGNGFVGKQEVIDLIFTDYSYDIPHFDCQSNRNIRDHFVSELGADIVDTFGLDENMIENCSDLSWWDL